jgi:peptidoglycan/LPS O-acetylase OafA/YrhL
MTAPARIVLIDQARGLAALGVTWFHLTNQYRDIVSSTGSMGWLGVEAFFVISGFVIPSALAAFPTRYGWRDFPDFMARRMIRLEPPYLVSIALVIALNGVAQRMPGFQGAPSNYGFYQIAAHFLYVIPLTHYEWVQIIYWTLAYEFVFYIAMAALFPWIGRSNRWPGRCVAAILIGLVAVGAISHLIALFVMGFAAFRLSSESETRSGSIMMIAASLAAMLYVHATPEAIVGTIVAATLAAHDTLKRIPGRAGDACIWLGTVSYSLYLIHIPICGKVVNMGRRFVHGPIADLALSLVALAVCLAVAWIFCALLERPARRLAHRLPALGRLPLRASVAG